MKKIIVILCILILYLSIYCPSIYAKGKNLYHLVQGGILKVYLYQFQSDVQKIPPEKGKDILKETLLTRKTENFEIVEEIESADVVISCKILDFKYSAKDPIDNFIGGTTALILDAITIQNYAQVQIKFTVLRARDNRKIWEDRIVSSITQSNLTEDESIPKVLQECSKRFISLCFGKPKR